MGCGNVYTWHDRMCEGPTLVVVANWVLYLH